MKLERASAPGLLDSGMILVEQGIGNGIGELTLRPWAPSPREL